MTATKKQKIRLEKTESLILPNVQKRFCPHCQSDQIFSQMMSILLKPTKAFIYL